MRRLAIACAAMLATTTAQAQGHNWGGLPGSVIGEVVRVFNDPSTIRRSGPTEVAVDSSVRGTLAVRTGPVTVAGHVLGSLIAINADVTFLQGARVDGGVLVVGGRIDGRDRAEIGGDVRTYADALRYRTGDDTIVAEGFGRGLIGGDDETFWSRQREGERTRFDFLTVAGGNTYSRVEGLPIFIGPRLRVGRTWGTVQLQARGIVRTANPIKWDRGTLGHDARAEVRWGQTAGAGAGATLFDRIDPVEDWQMPHGEAGLDAFFAHRDYRDYYSRHGGNAYVRGYFGEDAWVSFTYGAERWESRDARDPWTLFRNDEAWRPNPAINDGMAHLATVGLNVDTRNSRVSPGAGWYVQANVERGTLDPTPVYSIEGQPIGPTTTQRYTTGSLDARRYNRLAPGAQLNVRLVLGGWLAGDELPLSRRFSLGGPATMPGFDFRRFTGGEDRLQCSEGSTPASNLPALCDRVALMQIEYRGALSWETGGMREAKWWPTELDTPTWSIFYDVGRGWRAKDDGTTTYAVTSFPALNTFKSDLGMGLDFGDVSIALAKSITDHSEPLNVVVRLSRRF